MSVTGVLFVSGREAEGRVRLCNVRFTTIRANIDLSDVTVNSRTGDFNATSIAHIVNTESINRLIVQTWLDRAGE